MSVSLCEGYQASPACLSDEGLLRLRWVFGIGGMIMTGKNGSNMRNICPIATSSTTISHGVACDRTRVSVLRVWRLTAWPMARPWSAKLRYVTRNNPVAASKRTHFVSLKKSSWLILNREIIAVVARTVQKPQIFTVSKIQGFLSCQSMGYIKVNTTLQRYLMPFCVEACWRLITGSGLPLRRQW
jgi:hypothetical protein